MPSIKDKEEYGKKKAGFRESCHPAEACFCLFELNS